MVWWFAVTWKMNVALKVSKLDEQIGIPPFWFCRMLD